MDVPQGLNKTQEGSEEANKILKKNFKVNNMTVIDYRRELSLCKGTVKLKGKRKKTEAAKRKRAIKRASKRQQLIKEGKLKPRDYGIGVKPFGIRRYLKGDIVEKMPEVCHKYAKGFCLKGPICKYMHEEFPCKFYHLSHTCFAGAQCQFSHAPLNKKSRQILMNYVNKCEDNALNRRLREEEEALQQKLIRESEERERLEAVKQEPSVDEKTHGLNFYVDMLNEEQKPAVDKNMSDVHELKFSNLFLNEAPGDDLQSKMKSLEKLVSPPSPVLVKRGKILFNKKGNQSSFGQRKTDKQTSVCSSNSGITVKGAEKPQPTRSSNPIRLKLGFSFTAKNQIQKVKEFKKRGQYYSRVFDLVSMVQLMSKAAPSFCVSKHLDHFKKLWEKRLEHCNHGCDS